VRCLRHQSSGNYPKFLAHYPQRSNRITNSRSLAVGGGTSGEGVPGDVPRFTAHTDSVGEVVGGVRSSPAIRTSSRAQRLGSGEEMERP
jgi:hypothetical protein